MSYGVHIIRVSSAEEQARPISLEEWLSYVASDKEFCLKGEFVAMSPKGETIRCNAPGLAEWSGPSGGSKALFDHRRGRVTVGNPSPETLVKMFEVALALGAVVRGDEGESFNAFGKTL